MAIAAKMPMIATTTSSSINVKPFSQFLAFISFSPFPRFGGQRFLDQLLEQRGCQWPEEKRPQLLEPGLASEFDHLPPNAVFHPARRGGITRVGICHPRPR